MQKVVGSSPIIRFKQKAPLKRGFLLSVWGAVGSASPWPTSGLNVVEAAGKGGSAQ